MVFQVSLVGTDLVIVNVSQSDAGTYTCELDTDDITPLAVSHVLQILGKIYKSKSEVQKVYSKLSQKYVTSVCSTSKNL